MAKNGNRNFRSQELAANYRSQLLVAKVAPRSENVSGPLKCVSLSNASSPRVGSSYLN